MTDQDWPPAPRANTELTGHGHAEQTLLAAWRSGRMPHAWLIAGRQGIG
ncbi:MAG: DNA polymerase III subunit delta', partial [Alphaproteobacteria bacterium]